MLRTQDSELRPNCASWQAAIVCNCLQISSQPTHVSMRRAMTLLVNWPGNLRRTPMAYVFLFIMVFLGTSGAANAEQKRCGGATCGTPTKTTKTINGVNHNCDSTTCSKSCCTLGDPPVCSVEKTTTNSAHRQESVQARSKNTRPREQPLSSGKIRRSLRKDAASASEQSRLPR